MRTGITQMDNGLSLFHSTNKLIYIVSYILIFICSLLFSPSATAANTALKISTDPWEPWVIGKDMSVASEGIAIDLTKELFRRMKQPIDIRIYPYKRCINQMQTGERDILLMVKKTREREQYLDFSDVVVTDPQLVYYNSTRIKQFGWSKWEDFKGLSIGIVLGFNYGQFHAAATKHGLHVEQVSNDNLNIRKLLAGRVDLILLSRSTAEYYLKQNKQHRKILKTATKPIANAQFHFGLSKKGNATRHLKQINLHIKNMNSDGTLKKILGF